MEYFLHRKLHITNKFRLNFQQKKKLEANVITLCRLTKWLKKACVSNLLQSLTSSVLKFSIDSYQKTEDFPIERQVKHKATVTKPSVPFLRPPKLVDAENKTNEKRPTLDLPLEINYVTSKLEPHNLSSEKYDPNNEILLTQTTNPNLGKNCKFCHKSNDSVLNFFFKNNGIKKKENGKFSNSRSELPVNSFNQTSKT